MNVLVSESDFFSDDALKVLQPFGDVVLADLDRSSLLQSMQHTEVLWIRLRNRIDQEVLDAAPNLKVIVSPTTGLNHIDCEYAAQRGVHVLSLRGETEFLRTISATAELALGLALTLLRQIPEAVAHTRVGDWDRDQFKGYELQGKTVGVVGYGRLGRLVAGYFQAFGCRVIACDSQPVDVEPSVEFVSQQSLLEQSDIISLHVNSTPENYAFFNESCFSAMKSGAWLINTARGELIDESALLAALESGRLSGAALDVLNGEQSLAPSERLEHPLVQYAREHRHLIITPHIGGCTWESMQKTELFMANKVADWIGTTCPAS